MPFHLFDAFGIELEMMIVDAKTLDVRASADKVLQAMAQADAPVSDFEAGPISWSNELALHVLELKTNKPATDLAVLPSQFQTAIGQSQPYLDSLGLKLLPTAMHPWMDPTIETQLWPHECAEIYTAYDAIFDCRRQGWANVQSVHLNLPFCGDNEFAKLHAAVRLVLPILPALAASSPVVAKQSTGWLDNRLNYYATHCDAVPALMGDVIPEPLYDEASYRGEIFEQIAADIAPHNQTGAFQVDFLNARAAIARFDRGSIEIRLMDVQEQPAADVGICALVIAVLQELVAETWTPLDEQKPFPTGELRHLFNAASQTAEHTPIHNLEYLRHFGIEQPMTAGELWSQLLEFCQLRHDWLLPHLQPLNIVLEQGTLASRITAALGDDYSFEQLKHVYEKLANCLHRGESFLPLA